MLPLQKTFLAIYFKMQMDFYNTEEGRKKFDITEDLFYDPYQKHSPVDSPEWNKLWQMAVYEAPVDLCHILYVIRAGGAILVADKKYGARIKPDYDNENCIWDKNSYKEITECLKEHSGQLMVFLKRLAKEQ